MNRLLALGAALAVAVSADAADGHSWSGGAVIGRVSPGSASCQQAHCGARIVAERGTYASIGGDVDARTWVVGMGQQGTGLDRVLGGGPEAASNVFARLGPGDRVLLTGGADFLNGDQSLFGNQIVRLGPAPLLTGAQLFPSCGPAPWTQATLSRCYDEKRDRRAVTVQATVVGAPETDPRFSGAFRAILPVELASVRDGASDLSPPLSQDVAFVSAGAALIGATPRRPSVAKLDAGDRVVLEGAYVMPAPRAATRGGSCSGERCLPHLVVDRAIRLR